MAEPLRIGEHGYYTEFGETWPARVVADDIIQTFGAIDVLLAVTKWPGHECIVRLTERANSCTGGRWLSNEEFAAQELGAITAEMQALHRRAEVVLWTPVG